MQYIPNQIKELLKSDSVRKNFRVVFPNGEHDDIINDNIVQESVSFTESVCSQNTLKFGLAEASTLSFQTVGIGNIKGSVIDAEIEIDMSDITVQEPTADARTLDSDNNSVSFTIHPGQYIMIASDEEVSYSYILAMADASGVGTGLSGTWSSITNKLISFPSYIESTGLDLVTITLTLTLLNTASGATSTVTKYSGDCQTLIGMVDYDNGNSLSFTLEKGQGFKWACDELPAVSATIKGYNIDGILRITQTNYGFQTSLDSDIYTLADIVEILDEDDVVYATITLSLETSVYTETQISVYKIENAYDYSTTSADIDYPYYPIQYGRFTVESCKRSGEMEQRQVECYSYGSAGFQQQLIDMLEQGTWPVNTFTINQPESLLATYLFPKGIPQRYINSTSSITAETGTFESDFNKTYILTSDQTGYWSATPTLTMYMESSSVVQSYDVSNAAQVADRVIQIKVKKSSNYDTYLNSMVESALAFIESTNVSDYIHNSTGEIVYYDDEDAMRSIIEEMLRPKITSGGSITISSTTSDYHIITSELSVGTQVLYNQQYSNYSTSTGNYTASMYLFDYVKEFGSSGYIYMNAENQTTSITIPGQLYEVESVDILRISLFVEDKYEDMSFVYDYTGSREYSYSSASHTYYKFDISSELKNLCDSMLEINGQFLVCGRDLTNEVITLSDDSMESIDANLYSSLWYDDEAVPRLKGATFQYNDGTTDIIDTYGNVPYYDLTSNELIQYIYNVNSSESDIQTFLIDNFMDNVFMSAYIPYNLISVGLPYLEAGDYITVQDKEGNEFNSYIMRQTISGIQHLTSSMEAQSVDV